MDRDKFERLNRAITQFMNLDRNYYAGLETLLQENMAFFSESCFHVSDTIDKNKTLKILHDVLKDIGLPYTDFIRLMLPEPWSGPLVWKFLWHYACKDSPPGTLERQFASECGRGVLSRARNTIAEEIILKRRDVYISTPPARRRQTGDIVPHLVAYLNAFIECAMLSTFIKRYDAFLPENLKSLVPLLELSLNGGGFLYVASNFYWTVLEGKEMTQEEIQMLHDNSSLRWAVLEIRLPVWREADYPKNVVDIESTEPYFLQISVIRNGVYVPESVWRHPEKLTAKDIFREQNAAVRRAMIDVIGNEKLLKSPDAFILDKQGELILYRIVILFPNNGLEEIHILRCVCPSTGEEHLLRVPPGIRDARQAVAWTFGETKEAYKPEIET